MHLYNQTSLLSAHSRDVKTAVRERTIKKTATNPPLLHTKNFVKSENLIKLEGWRSDREENSYLSELLTHLEATPRKRT